MQPYAIEHSGKRFVSLGRAPNGMAVWPIEEYLVRAKHKPTVMERIARLNPNGKPEGEYPRGVYRGKPAKWYRRKVAPGG